jgi:hypothetical protein
MLEFFLNIVQILIGVYWAGEVARQNPKIDSFVAQLESGYEKFNLSLKDTKIVEGLAALRRIYGWLAVATIIFFFAFSRFFASSLDRVVTRYLARGRGSGFARRQRMRRRFSRNALRSPSIA